MQETGRQTILLESGTNEMELIEFYLGSQSFGINVHKLREIIPYDESKVTVLPESPPSVVGLFLVRGENIPIVDLGKHLNRREQVAEDPDIRRVVLVCEFNGRVNSFLVDGVNQIHRVNWKDVSPISNILEKYRPRFTGSLHVEDRESLIVDLEHIISEIDPEMGMSYELDPKEEARELSITERRGKVHLMIAEDSSLIRAGILKVLTGSGYTQVSTFVDGEECFHAIRALQQEALTEGVALADKLDLLISDIEMPRMDGLTLCRRLRQEMGLKDLPILIFSSLITEQMKFKCDAVGASGCVSKPQIPLLVELVDKFCL